MSNYWPTWSLSTHYFWRPGHFVFSTTTTENLPRILTIERRNNWVTYLNRERVERWNEEGKVYMAVCRTKKIRTQACLRTLPCRGVFPCTAPERKIDWKFALRDVAPSTWSVALIGQSHLTPALIGWPRWPWFSPVLTRWRQSRKIVVLTRVVFVYIATLVSPRRCLRLWSTN